MALVTLLFTLTPLIKNNSFKKTTYLILLILSVGLAIYYFLTIRLRNKRLENKILIAQNKQVIYYSTLQPFMAKRSKRDLFTLSLLNIVLNVFYYSIVFTSIKKVNITWSYFIFSLLIMFVIF